MKGLDDHSIYCYFKVRLQPGTLKQDFTDRQCSFLVNLLTNNSSTSASYEQYLNFVIPRTKKKITKKLISKIRQTEQPICNSNSNRFDYDAVCALAKLFECEISLLKKI